MKALKEKKKERGVTLVELMIALSMFAVILSAMYNMFNFQQKSYSVQDNVAVMQQNVRVGLGYMVKEIRMAGYIPDGIPPNKLSPSNDSLPSSPFTTNGVSESVEEATASSITFQADIDGDNITEAVRYILDAGNEVLTREVWQWNAGTTSWDASTGPEIVAEDIENIVFTYTLLASAQGLANGIDDDGDGSVDEQGELIFWDIDNGVDDDGDGNVDEDGALNTNTLRGYIRQVGATITARSASTDINYTHPVQGDHYRRRILTSNIGLRNM